MQNGRKFIKVFITGLAVKHTPRADTQIYNSGGSKWAPLVNFGRCVLLGGGFALRPTHA